MGNNFKKQSSSYTKDTFNVYYNNKRVDQATAMTFENLGNSYGKDIFDVFYKGVIIPNADALTFMVDSDGLHAYDTLNTYYMGKKV